MLYGACQWGVLSVLAKFGGAPLLGRFALALAVTAPLSVLASLQLRSIYATDVRDEFSWSTYLNVRIRISVVCVALLVGFASITPSLRGDLVIIGVVAIAKGVEMTSDLCFGVFLRHRAMHHFGRSLAIRGVSSVCIVAATLGLGAPLELSLLGMLSVWVAVLVMHDWPAARRLRGPEPSTPASSDRGLRLVWLALPMGGVMLMDSLTQNVPRYLIESFWSASDLGVYVAMAYVIQVGATVVFALGGPMASAMASDYQARRAKQFVRGALGLIAVTMGLGVCGVLFAWLFGRPFLRLAYSSEFSDSADVFIWVMSGAAFHYIIVMCNNVLTSARLLRIQLLIWSVTLLSTTIAAWAWVPTGGILGAARAFVVGVGLGAVVAIFLVAVAVRTLATAQHT